MGSSRWPRSTSTASRTAFGRPISTRASSAARTVRPVYRTSSTITSVLDSSSNGRSVPLTRGLASAGLDVVAVKADVEAADRRSHALVALDGARQPLGQRHAARLDADEGEAVSAAVLLDDLVTDANQRPAHIVGGHDLARGHGRKD